MSHILPFMYATLFSTYYFTLIIVAMSSLLRRWWNIVSPTLIYFALFCADIFISLYILFPLTLIIL